MHSTQVSKINLSYMYKFVTKENYTPNVSAVRSLYNDSMYHIFSEIIERI